MASNNPRLSRRSFLKLIGLLTGNTILFGAGGMFYAKQIEPTWIEISQVRLNLPKLGKAFQGFKLLQISDIHMGGWMDVERFLHVIKLANAQKADLIALTGDYVCYLGQHLIPGNVLEDLNKAFQTLGDVPRVGVLGNHDYRTSPAEIRKMLDKNQILDLTNSTYTIERNGERLHIAGVDEILYGHPDLSKVVKAIPSEGSAILLSHEPDFADESAQTGRFDLQISGHSHGGQVVFPLLGPPYLPRGARKYYTGLYQIGSMLLYTNRGIGMVEPYIRFNCRPEITVFTLDTI